MRLGVWIVVGTAIGIAIGIATKQLAMGVALGVAFGVSIGSFFRRRRRLLESPSTRGPRASSPK